VNIYTASWKRSVSFLCIFLILTCASAVIIPHSHEHAGYDCSLCEFIEISRYLSLGLYFSVLICLQTEDRRQESFHVRSSSERKRSPVSLKVKLSN
jgi:hypothetical protein